MKIKNVVKVMNFQSLLKVDKARRQAEKYQNVGKEITDILEKIMYNKNLILDKKIMFPDSSLPMLNIYIANDYGFCGNFNSSINKELKKDADNYKVIVGKKITYNDDKTILKIEKDEFYKKFQDVERLIDKTILEGNFSKINVFYNHYYSSTSFEFVKIQLFPIEFKGKYYEGEDFVAETDLNKVLSSLATFYICYQLKMCESISYAAENLLRSQITSDALEKIEEKEAEEKIIRFKEKKDKSIRKSVENFKKIS